MRSTRVSSRTSRGRTSPTRSTRRGRRRRPHPGAHAGPCRSGVVHARLVGAAPELVRPRHRGHQARRAATRSRAASSPRRAAARRADPWRPRAPAVRARTCECARSRETRSHPRSTSRSPATIAPTSDAPRNAGASTSSVRSPACAAFPRRRRCSTSSGWATRASTADEDRRDDRLPRSAPRRRRTNTTIGRNVNTNP